MSWLSSLALATASSSPARKYGVHFDGVGPDDRFSHLTPCEIRRLTVISTCNNSQQAESYDSKHEKTLNQIVKEIQSRLDFINVDWVEDADEESDADGSKRVRLLDYACGTGVGKDFFLSSPCCFVVLGGGHPPSPSMITTGC